MKNQFLFLLLLILTSCQKEKLAPKQQPQPTANYYKDALYFSAIGYNAEAKGVTWWTPWLQNEKARVSVWFLSHMDNYMSSRLDYVELMYSDEFYEDDTYNPYPKAVDSTMTNLMALKNPYSKKMQWKREMVYPKDGRQDSVDIATWRLNEPHGGYMKIICANFPQVGANSPYGYKVYLWDDFDKYRIELPTNNETIWYGPFSTINRPKHSFKIVTEVYQ